MKAAKNLSFQHSTWGLIEKFMERNGINEVSHAAEQLVLLGLEAEKEKEKVNPK